MSYLKKYKFLFDTLTALFFILSMVGEVWAQKSGATDFNINSSSIAQRRAGSTSANNFARNNPGYDPCLSPTGLQSGARCDGEANPASGNPIPLLSAINVGGATNLDNNRQGGFFHATSYGAVTDNMFGAVSAILNCGRDAICGAPMQATIMTRHYVGIQR